MEDEYFEDDFEEWDEEARPCEECDWVQRQIYEANVRLRTDLSDREQQETKRRLDRLVQDQLLHQREHL